ncbi:MAG: hypothetical protein JRJ65_15015 [Deltaproteobacteria bacterium]|nr:hypothetical protein [Deltaproteobacteria bacterium]
MTEKEKKGSIASAIIWMFVISLLLFWLPVLGPLVAGFVGGKKSGGVGSAIIAVFLPGILFGIVLFVLAGSISGLPIIGLVAGAGGFVLAIAHIGPLLIGAIIGGIFA